MDATTYIPAMLLAFSGLGIGMIIGFFAREEIAPGEKYLKLLQSALFMLALASLLHYMQLGIIFRLALYLAAIIFLLSKINTSEFAYPALAAMFYLASRQQSAFLIVSGIVLLYGLPAGSRALKKYAKKEAALAVLRNSSFIFISIILFLQFS